MNFFCSVNFSQAPAQKQRQFCIRKFEKEKFSCRNRLSPPYTAVFYATAVLHSSVNVCDAKVTKYNISDLWYTQQYTNFWFVILDRQMRIPFDWVQWKERERKKCAQNISEDERFPPTINHVVNVCKQRSNIMDITKMDNRTYYTIIFASGRFPCFTLRHPKLGRHIADWRPYAMHDGNCRNINPIKNKFQ